MQIRELLQNKQKLSVVVRKKYSYILQKILLIFFFWGSGGQRLQITEGCQTNDLLWEDNVFYHLLLNF
jgi:hypothetical protein